MSDFDAVDSLLAAVGPEAGLPSPRVRRELRERARLSKAQVARALGVSPSTVAAWESGRDPAGGTRTKYAYLLDGLAAKFAAGTAPVTPSAAEAAVAHAPAPADAPAVSPAPAEDGEGDEVEALTVPEPCVLCGYPAGQRVAGFAQHLDPADCQTTAAAPPDQPAALPAPSAAAPARPEAAPAGKPAAVRTPRTAAGLSERSRGPAGRAFQEPSGPVDLIGQAAQAALAEHHGDVEAATAALLKRAIADAMRLLDESRKGARYDVIAHPWIPDILRKQTSRGADQIWEARPKWTRAELPPGRHEVTALDINGAYLSALKTHLPLGRLEHSAGLAHDRRRAGVYLITPPAWEHEAVLPNPIGN
ncbi:helix-turn-helix domain-containing protein, partial [Streptomyces sp. NPDC002536]